jgi:hypothetical protein
MLGCACSSRRTETIAGTAKTAPMIKAVINNRPSKQPRNVKPRRDDFCNGKGCCEPTGTLAAFAVEERFVRVGCGAETIGAGGFWAAGIGRGALARRRGGRFGCGVTGGRGDEFDDGNFDEGFGGAANVSPGGVV